MPFNFCPKRDASFWENGSELKRFVLELQTGGFADYTTRGFEGFERDEKG